MPGDVQWMTAGSGVIHSEVPAPSFYEQGGKMHGFQIWINLPRDRKMIPPRYQDTPAEKIPEVLLEDGVSKVRVIAGEFQTTRALNETNTPILYLHIKLQAGMNIAQPVTSDHNCMAYIIEGHGLFGAEKEHQSASEGQLVLFARNGDGVCLSSGKDSPVELLLLAGRPFNEEIARYGPFVMNTREEIFEAFQDYQQGKMGMTS